MGKSKRIRADRADVNAVAKSSKKEDKNTKRTSIIIVCVIVALLAATIALIVVNKSGVIARSNVLYESENYKVNEMMFDYLFYNNYNTQYSYYASLISSEYVSYFVNKESIAETTKENVQDYLLYCEAAKAAGVKLGDFENRKIDEAIEDIKETVKSTGYTLGAIYGCDGMNYSDVRNMLEIQYLANKFSGDNKKEMTENITSDAARVLKYFEDNKADFVTGSYISAEASDDSWKGDLSTVESADDFIKLFIDLYVDRNFVLGAAEDEETENTEDAEEPENNESENEAEETEEIPEISEALKDALKKTIADMIKVIDYEIEIDDVSVDEYTAADIKTVYEAKYAVEGEEIDDTVFDYAATTANALKKNVTEALKVVDGGYKDETEAEKWVFAEKEEKEAGQFFLSAREEKEIYTSEESDIVVFIKEVPTYDDKATKNVGHILVKVDDSEDEDELAKAKEKADNILKEFQGMAQTEENFKALGEKYTADSKVIYHNVKSGEMTTEFNDWIFDEERKEGDTDVVKTTYGYHVMFFLGDGVQQWELTALENDDEDGMLDKDFSAWKEELVAKYPVKINEDAIAKFDASIA